MDILQPLAFEKWGILGDFLKQDWPLYAYYYHYVINAIKWKKKDPLLELEIYCPDGRENTGVFVGILKCSRITIVLFSFENSRALLKKVLEKTNKIVWNEYAVLSSVHKNFQSVVNDFFRDEGEARKISVRKSVNNYFFKPKEECRQMEVTIPDECELRHLDLSHVSLITSLWPHSNKYTYEFLATMVRLNTGVGLFLKKDNLLVSWALHTDLGSLGMLQTIDEHKKKGYGKVIVKALVKELAEKENLDSTLFVVENNVPSGVLFKSLGYREMSKVTWYHINSN